MTAQEVCTGCNREGPGLIYRVNGLHWHRNCLLARWPNAWELKRVGPVTRWKVRQIRYFDPGLRWLGWKDVVVWAAQEVRVCSDGHETFTDWANLFCTWQEAYEFAYSQSRKEDM